MVVCMSPLIIFSLQRRKVTLHSAQPPLWSQAISFSLAQCQRKGPNVSSPYRPQWPPFRRPFWEIGRFLINSCFSNFRMVNPGIEQVIARSKFGKGSFQLRDRSLKSSFCGSVRIPTDIGDSSRYTLPLPAFRLRTDDFSSMHTTPRKMCPRHQKICCKNPFPKMQSFFGFGTRRLFNVGCFINIFGAKTTQKHCSF